jgi:hypothetical protein
MPAVTGLLGPQFAENKEALSYRKSEKPGATGETPIGIKKETVFTASSNAYSAVFLSLGCITVLAAVLSYLGGQAKTHTNETAKHANFIK